MIEEKIIEEIKPFVDACDKMAASKFIMIDKRISDVLKSIAKTDIVFNAIKECMINFNFEKEFALATAKLGQMNAPTEAHKFIAFAFSLLNYLDDKKLSASEVLSRYFSKSENSAGPYNKFCSEIIIRFKDTLVAKLLNRDFVSVSVKTKSTSVVDKDILSRLAFLMKDLKEYVLGLKKLKKSTLTKGELLEIVSSAIECMKNGHADYVKAFSLAIKAGKGKDKEIDRRLVEINEIISKI